MKVEKGKQNNNNNNNNKQNNNNKRNGGNRRVNAQTILKRFSKATGVEVVVKGEKQNNKQNNKQNGKQNNKGNGRRRNNRSKKGGNAKNAQAPPAPTHEQMDKQLETFFEKVVFRGDYEM